MVNLISDFLSNRLQKLRKRVCYWTRWKVFHVFHIWKVCMRLSRKALHDMESETYPCVWNDLQDVITGFMARNPLQSESCTRLYIAEYMVRYPLDRPNVVSSSKPP